MTASADLLVPLALRTHRDSIYERRLDICLLLKQVWHDIVFVAGGSLQALFFSETPEASRLHYNRRRALSGDAFLAILELSHSGHERPL